MIGMLVGGTAIFYLTRDVPRLLREAFLCANLFMAFNFGINFNKALGVFLMGLIVLSTFLKFGAPFLKSWLVHRPRPAAMRRPLHPARRT